MSQLTNKPAAATVTNPGWTLALELDQQRRLTRGSFAALAKAIGRGADLRIYTEFLHEEHIAPFGSPPTRDFANNGVIEEVTDFRVVYLVDGKHVAGVTTLRQPLEPTTGFNGAEPKMSFFLYNMDGWQACANLLLDGTPTSQFGRSALEPTPSVMPKMSPTEYFDLGTAGPSRNFIYDMEVYRYFVRDDWQEIYAHDGEGQALTGSFAAIEHAQRTGQEIKVGIRALCADLGEGPDHEVYSLAGSTFLHRGQKYLEALTHPLVRVRSGIPMKYGSKNWDVTWVFVRSDGHGVFRVLNPITRKFEDRVVRLACRWFAR